MTWKQENMLNNKLKIKQIPNVKCHIFLNFKILKKVLFFFLKKFILKLFLLFFSGYIIITSFSCSFSSLPCISTCSFSNWWPLFHELLLHTYMNMHRQWTFFLFLPPFYWNYFFSHSIAWLQFLTPLLLSAPPHSPAIWILFVSVSHWKQTGC